MNSTSGNQQQMSQPSIEQQVAELKASGWIPLTLKCWKAPAGSGFAGCFLGPHGAWVAMKRRESALPDPPKETAK